MNDETAEREIVAVRGMVFIIRNLRLIAPLMIALGLLGFAIGAMMPRPYHSEASIEVGVRFPMEPLESPLVARERLGGILEQNRTKYPGVTEFELENVYDTKTRSLTRVIKVSALSETASVAQSILQVSIAELIEQHRPLHALELELLDRERTHYQAAEKKIGETLAELGGGAEVPSSNLPDAKSPRLLSGALLELQRAINLTNATRSGRRMPQTGIVEPPSKPELVGSRAILLGIAGVLLGMLLGVALGLVGELVRAPSRERSVSAIEEHHAHRAP